MPGRQEMKSGDSSTELLDQLQNIDIVYEQQLVQVKRSPELSQTLEKLRKRDCSRNRTHRRLRRVIIPSRISMNWGTSSSLLEEQAGSLLRS